MSTGGAGAAVVAGNSYMGGPDSGCNYMWAMRARQEITTHTEQPVPGSVTGKPGCSTRRLDEETETKVCADMPPVRREGRQQACPGGCKHARCSSPSF